MSMKINVTNLSISPRKKGEIDYAEYVENLDKSEEPFIEIEFVDEEEGFVGLYPGLADLYGVRVDCTTAASLLRVCILMHDRKSIQKIQYALNGATVIVSNEGNVENYVEIIVNVHEQFSWSADMTVDSLRLIGEGLEYALDQFEASLFGKETFEIEKEKKELPTEIVKPQMVQRHHMSSSSPKDDDWGSES